MPNFLQSSLDLTKTNRVKPINNLITSHLFEAYLHCPTKCFLLAAHEAAPNNSYSEWAKHRNEIYRRAGIERLTADFDQEGIIYSPETNQLRRLRWNLAVNSVVCTQGLETSIDVIECLSTDDRSDDQEKTTQFIPYSFLWANKLSRTDKLLLAYNAHVLAKCLGRTIGSSKIIHGDRQIVTKVKPDDFARDVKKIIGKITAILVDALPPKMALNRHCPECEFRERCHKLAIDKDDLSLLSGLSDKERAKLNSKGIFSVTQLSFTFHPRRRSKRHVARAEKYHHSLKALSIREQKIHIVGRPQLKIEGTPVFLDVEGLPDRGFYYLIGVRLKTMDGIVQHGLWADDNVAEKTIWVKFLSILSEIERPVLIHYGSFETTFLKKMCDRYGGPSEGSIAQTAIKSSINLLSVIYAQIYFPVHYNGLKEIAKYLGFNWADPLASGLQSLVWRYQWEQSHDFELREKLIRYNTDDCEALALLTDTLGQYLECERGTNHTQSHAPDIVHADFLKDMTNKWKIFKSPILGFEQINSAAHWDYQQDRVYARINKKPKSKGQQRPHKISTRFEKIVTGNLPPHCPKCESKERKIGPLRWRVLFDLEFGENSLQRSVVKYEYRKCCCSNCKHKYGIDEKLEHLHKYGWNLVAYFIFNVIGLCITQKSTQYTLNRLFGFDLLTGSLKILKAAASDYYSITTKNILDRIISGHLIHVDETQANIGGKLAYVWVLTNLREVVYVLAESRDGEFIQKLLANFKGVLVSDFYAAYEAIDCPQQKCLIHLIRDLNDDILKAPFDDELKNVAAWFSSLLQPIVETIDQYGLKKRFLGRHRHEVQKFYKYLGQSNFKSDIALKYKHRFEKNQNKLFTFLRYDGIPWNNNNAEHAIKAFAKLRDIIGGRSTKDSLDRYLTLLSVCRTCEYQGIDFLNFLRSGVKDIAKYALEYLPHDHIPGRRVIGASNIAAKSGDLG